MQAVTQRMLGGSLAKANLLCRGFLFPAANAVVPASGFKVQSTLCQANQNDRLFKKIELEVRGHDHAVLQSYMEFVAKACNHLDVEVTPTEKLRYVRWIQPLLRSKFAHKKYKLHYETRTHIKKCSVLNLTGSTASTLLEYVQRQVPEGVGMKVTYEEICEFPDAIKKQAS